MIVQVKPIVGVVVVFVNLDEIGPSGGTHTPDVLPMIAERYGFTFRPQLSDSVEKLRQNGIKFEMGKFVHGGKECVITDFTIWNDGLVATATSTEDAESFLADVLTWGKEKLNLRVEFSSLRLRAYKSALAVEFDRSLAKMLAVFEPISKAYNEVLSRTYDKQFPPTEISSVRIDYDHAIAPAAFNTFSPFVVERRENHRFSEDNVYFSQAPIQTEDHIKLLETFEHLLS